MSGFVRPVPPMTQEEFFLWAEVQDARYEFDGMTPVAMTGGNLDHGTIMLNLQAALRERLRGGPCRSDGPDAGVETIGRAVRYPDAVVTCSRTPGTDRLVPSPVIVFEVLGPSSGRTDRLVKLNEYRAVPSIRRYVILEHAAIGATVLARPPGIEDWTATAVTAGGTLALPEVGTEIPIDLLYEGTDVAAETT